MAIDLTAVTLTELRYIVAIAEHRHFGRAARECSVTQPTLSAQVAKLERTLGVQIFERTSKSVHLTLIGKQIVEQARLVLDATEKILDLVQSQKDPLSGPLRLGVIPTLSPYLLPWLYPPLRSAFPRLKLVFREVKTGEMLDELAQHRLDCGILALPLTATGLVTMPLFEEPFWLLVSNAHPLAARPHVRESDLARERVLLLEEGHCLREQALSICAKAKGIRIDPAEEGDFRATSIETLRHMVAAGMGCTLLPALAVGEGGETTSVIAVPFEAPVPARKMALCWRRTHPRAQDFVHLGEFIREHLPAAVIALGENQPPRRAVGNTGGNPRASGRTAGT